MPENFSSFLRSFREEPVLLRFTIIVYTPLRFGYRADGAEIALTAFFPWKLTGSFRNNLRHLLNFSNQVEASKAVRDESLFIIGPGVSQKDPVRKLHDPQMHLLAVLKTALSPLLSGTLGVRS